jgi:hypothetical protein
VGEATQNGATGRVATGTGEQSLVTQNGQQEERVAAGTGGEGGSEKGVRIIRDGKKRAARKEQREQEPVQAWLTQRWFSWIDQPEGWRNGRDRKKARRRGSC